MKIKRKLFSLLLAICLVMGFTPTVLAAPKEIQITITHNNPNHYEGVFTATATVTDSAGEPIENLTVRMSMYFSDSSVSPLYPFTTDENGQVQFTHLVKRAQNVTLEVIFEGNDTYAAKTVRESLFTTVSDTPVLNTHWEMDSYTVDEDGRVATYTLQLCDENGEPVKKTMMLYVGKDSAYASVVDGKLTWAVNDTEYDSMYVYFYTMQTVCGDEVYPEMPFKLTVPFFEFTQPITYGVPYTAYIVATYWEYPSILPHALQEDGAAVCTLPDGTEVPLTYVKNLSGGYDGLMLQLTGEQTSQQGTYTLSFPEKSETGGVVLPYKTTTVCEKTVFTLTPQNDTITIAPGDAAVGETVFVQCEAGEGYAQALTSATAQLSDGTEVTLSPQADGTYAFTMPAGSVKITAVFEPIDYTVTVSTDNAAYGTVSANPDSANIGDTVTLTATANEGYEFVEWQVVSGNIAIVDNSFTMPAQDIEIKAVFKAKTNTGTDNGSGSEEETTATPTTEEETTTTPTTEEETTPPTDSNQTGDKDNPDTGTTTTPATGDTSNITLWTAVLLVSGAALTSTVVYVRKRKYR